MTIIKQPARRRARAGSHEKGAAVLEFALCTIVLLPLFFGTIALGMNLGRSLQVTQVSRDVSVMYSRGIDFSKPGAQEIIRELAGGMRLTADGNAAVILSQVTVVNASDCRAGGFGDTCANLGSPVFLNRIALGNSTLRQSNFGSPSGMNAQGNIPPATYLDNPGARGNSRLASELAAADVAQRSGEIAFIVEVWFDTPELNPFGTVITRGVYAKSLF
jgi:hypothetical protein